MMPCGVWGGLQETTTALLLKGLAPGFIEFSPKGAGKETNNINIYNFNVVLADKNVARQNYYRARYITQR